MTITPVLPLASAPFAASRAIPSNPRPASPSAPPFRPGPVGAEAGGPGREPVPAADHAPWSRRPGLGPPAPPRPAPPACDVPQFDPVRVRRWWGRRWRWPCRGWLRLAVAGLVVIAATAIATVPGAGEVPATASARVPGGAPPSGAAVADPDRPAERTVSAPVRIADAATVRLLRPGDRVDVLAAPTDGSPGPVRTRVVARGVRVARVPAAGPAAGSGEEGALIVLAVGRSTATELVGASVTSRLAVTLC
ncbi:RcpC/CpaB family pilus assembly protein [Streptomyces pactum]|uniref:RcpC/CpaB family pilus assembly protein n=1 Tax=Streptomyces pactum TaxID=68249 RepID=UPI003701E291